MVDGGLTLRVEARYWGFTATMTTWLAATAASFESCTCVLSSRAKRSRRACEMSDAWICPLETIPLAMKPCKPQPQQQPNRIEARKQKECCGQEIKRPWRQLAAGERRQGEARRRGGWES